MPWASGFSGPLPSFDSNMSWVLITDSLEYPGCEQETNLAENSLIRNFRDTLKPFKKPGLHPDHGSAFLNYQNSRIVKLHFDPQGRCKLPAKCHLTLLGPFFPKTLTSYPSHSSFWIPIISAFVFLVGKPWKSYVEKPEAYEHEDLGWISTTHARSWAWWLTPVTPELERGAEDLWGSLARWCSLISEF